jgi:hypothetical protein
VAKAGSRFSRKRQSKIGVVLNHERQPALADRRNTQMGYDRAFLIGDTNISGSYDVTTEFVLHGYDSEGWAFGAASGWLGHTLDNYGTPLPSQPFIGHPFPAWAMLCFGTVPHWTGRFCASCVRIVSVACS